MQSSARDDINNDLLVKDQRLKSDESLHLGSDVVPKLVTDGKARVGKGAEIRFDGIVETLDQKNDAFMRRRMDSIDSDAAAGVSKEIYNFQSAPQNAVSALKGNKPLQERYEQF